MEIDAFWRTTLDAGGDFLFAVRWDVELKRNLTGFTAERSKIVDAAGCQNRWQRFRGISNEEVFIR